MQLFWILFSLETFDSALRLTTPLLLAALAGLFSERSGIFDIGLEGKMLIGAFAAGTVAALSGSALLGLGAAVLVSIMFALVHGFASITQRGNQIVSGVAMNFLASGLSAFLGQAWFGEGGRTPQLTGAQRFEGIHLYGELALRDVPVIGSIYANLISGHNILVYLALFAVPLTAWIVYRTRFGLRLRAVGENPAAVDTAGISVTFLRYRAVIITGILCGFAGAYLSTAQSAGFGREMTAGQGYIALAALIFANWRPWRVLGATFLFGWLNAVAIRLQGFILPDSGLLGWIVWALPYLVILGFAAIFVSLAQSTISRLRPVIAVPIVAGLVIATAFLILELWSVNLAGKAVPVQFVQALPYILTVILLAGFIGKSIPPKAGGVPYVKER
jgi:general nucleoside transport system permease protein